MAAQLVAQTLETYLDTEGANAFPRGGAEPAEGNGNVQGGALLNVPFSKHPELIAQRQEKCLRLLHMYMAYQLCPSNPDLTLKQRLGL